MADNFKYDAFLCYSPKDKLTIRALAERLRKDRIKVWLDEWEIKPRDSIPHKIEEGLEHSRILVFCMSANAFGSDWTALESQTFRFRDPLNKERHFIPLRLDDVHIKGSLAQFLYIDWRNHSLQSYEKLVSVCSSPSKTNITSTNTAYETFSSQIKSSESDKTHETYVYSPDLQYVLSISDYKPASLWSLETGHYIRTFNGSKGLVNCLSWSPSSTLALTGSDDMTIRLWDIQRGICLHLFEGHSNPITSLSWGPVDDLALSGTAGGDIRLWEVSDLKSRYCLRSFDYGHRGRITCISWSPDGKLALSGSDDRTIRLWDVQTGYCLNTFESHTDSINTVVWSPNGTYFLSGSGDRTIRQWELDTKRCLRVYEGHTHSIWDIAWSPDGKLALSGSDDRTIRLWNIQTGYCIHTFEGHPSGVNSLMWDISSQHFFSGDISGNLRVWNIPEFINDPPIAENPPFELHKSPKQIQYTNAKVLLVGDSGAGKTGLSKRLSINDWQPTDSTVGVWATQWNIQTSFDEDKGDVEREIWLWDFGGQADQRLIHQLYMDETALAVLVFDGQKEGLFETLGQWDRDLSRASDSNLAKLLVAGRVDAGGLRISKAKLEDFGRQLGYSQLLETSAKTAQGCNELKEAIKNSIKWENIPWRSSPMLFKQLKEEIVRLKDKGRVLMRFNELREALEVRLYNINFSDDELKAVISLLKGPGVLWELKFGNWVLLQPERINSYAQAVIQTLKLDRFERGCLPQEQVLNGELTYHSSITRLKDKDEERIVLIAMHQTLVERGLCLRENTDLGPLLVFPSYYRRERPELIGHPAVLVSYRFSGFLDDIYATLVVRLHHTNSFEQDELWRYAADFKTLTGKKLGVKLTRLAEGNGELEVYFDSSISIEEKIIFSKYVHNHLIENAKDVVRLRHYVCPHCGTPVGNLQVAMKKLEEGKTDIPCINCDNSSKRIPLWDQLEELFASQDIKQQVHILQEQSAYVIDNESKERALVGEVISTVALAGQISREFNISDHGIDMEIEFKSDAGEATGKKLYLQLKSGDSYLRERKRDGVEVFTVKDERHTRYWMEQAFPVLLIIRNSEGKVRWMEVSNWLKKAIGNGKKPVSQIIFEGEQFDVMSVRHWRDKALNSL